MGIFSDTRTQPALSSKACLFISYQSMNYVLDFSKDQGNLTAYQTDTGQAGGKLVVTCFFDSFHA